MGGIQRNRGCHIRNHRSGIRVIQYLDEPNSYYDGNGKPVTEEVAQQAGYNVDEDRRNKALLQKRRKFERDLVTGEATQDERSIAELIQANESKIEIVPIKGKQDRFALVDGEGRRITKVPATIEEAKLIYRQITGKAHKEATKPPGKPPAAKRKRKGAGKDDSNDLV